MRGSDPWRVAIRGDSVSLMGRTSARLAAVLLAASPLLAGCKSKPEKICQHLEEILFEPAAGASVEKGKTSPEEKARCVADIQRELDQCENAETIASCYVEARTLDAIATCESKCQKKLKPKPGMPGGAAAPRAPGAPGPQGEPRPQGEPGEPAAPSD